MAYIKLDTTKVANRAISYAKKRAVEKSGHNCMPETAKTQFSCTRGIWNKNDGIQAHLIIQSFNPGEITPQLANQLGRELAAKVAADHEAVIYTHADKEHIHNHIVINSVNLENGRKLNMHNALGLVRELSNELSKEHGLSVIQEPYAKLRYTMAERQLLEKGGISWKDEIRQAVDIERKNSRSFSEFKANLEENFNIKVALRGQKHITFTHPNGSKARGNRLGLDYDRGGIENGFARQAARSTEQARTEGVIDWGAVEHSLGNEKDRLPKQPGNEILGAIQQAIREVKERADRATESTKKRNSQLEADGRQPKRNQPASKQLHRDRDWEMER